jgi:predicted DNA binding CopG/RHH family protein
MIRESQRKYNQGHIKRIPLDVQSSEYELIKKRAESLEIPVNTYIKELIRKDLAE